MKVSLEVGGVGSAHLRVSEVELGVQGVGVVLRYDPREPVVLDRHAVPNKLGGGGGIGGLRGRA